MTLYYQDRQGDWMEVDHGTRRYYRDIGQPNIRQARATAIKNMPESICTCGVSVEWVRENCRRVARRDVPTEWLLWIDGKDHE